MKQAVMLGLLVLCVVLIGSVQAAPVVRNGDFETPNCYAAGYSDTITPWETVTGFWRIYDTTDGGMDYAYPDINPNPWTGQAITNASASPSGGELKQKAYEADGVTPSVITENMSLIFDLDVSSQAGDFQADWFQVLLILDADGTIVGASDQVTVPLYGTWEHKTVTVTIPGTSGLVGQEYSFSFWNNNGAPYYDNVSIVLSDVAFAPSPGDGATNVPIDTDLGWIAGQYALSHDVYFGTSLSAVTNAQRLAGDINGDGPVDILDLSILGFQWLTNPGAVNPSADAKLSGTVDLEDFAVVAADWGATPDAEFKGNRTGTTFDPGALGEAIYYWRIDEVNPTHVDSPWEGQVWSFSTIPTKWFGYLYVYFDGWLNDIPSVAGYTNMNHILMYPGGSTNGIQSAIANGTKVLLDVKFLCFEEPTYHDFDLRSDWEAQLNAFKAQYDQYKDHIVALTPMDEPYWHGVTESEVEQVATKLRADFPGIPIYLNLYKDGWGGMDLYHRTSSSYVGVDWVAFDTFDGHTFDYNEFVNLLNHLKSIKTSSQKIILNIPNMSECGTDAQIASWNWDIYNNLMKNDDEIIGSLIWLGDTYRIATYPAVEGPLPVNKAALEDIGHLITGK